MTNKNLKALIVSTIILSIIAAGIIIITLINTNDVGSIFIIISTTIITYIITELVLIKYYKEKNKKIKIEAYIKSYVIENNEHYPIVSFFDKNNVQHVGREKGIMVNNELSHASIEMMYGTDYLKKEFPIKIMIEYDEENPDDFNIWW